MVLIKASTASTNVDTMSITASHAYDGRLSGLLQDSQMHDPRMPLHTDLDVSYVQAGEYRRCTRRSGARAPLSHLLYKEHVECLWHRHLPPRDHPQQRGLALAVGPHQAVPPPRGDGERRAFQQHLALCTDCEVVHLPSTTATGDHLNCPMR
jgi:hypothetical protein